MECYDALRAAPAGAQDRENVRLFIEHIAAIELTQAEVVQLINLKPTERVTVHAVVEKCARRLTEDEVDDLLHLCEKYL
jgi:DNA-directed RNA polymerase subunit F